MRINYKNVNANKLHDELILGGITPLLVENIDADTWITFSDDANMAVVQNILDAHDPTPISLPQEPTLEERVTTTETKVVTLQETIDVIFGGV